MSIDHQQSRGVAWDIVDEAIDTFDQWMLDDRYDAHQVLQQIIRKMKERRDLYKSAGATRNPSTPFKGSGAQG